MQGLPETSLIFDRQAVVPPAMAGERFDRVLAELFPEFSRSRLAEWVKSGQALLNGRTVRPKQSVIGGETISIKALPSVEVESRPESIPLEILFEDEHLLIINKPPGLVVHPGAGNPSGTLLNALVHYDAKLQAVPRGGIVHRLDKDTSGAMMIARTLQAHARLVEMLSAREIHRQYEAVIEGVLVAGGTIDAAIDRHPHDRVKQAVSERGKDAVTHYRVYARFRAHTHVQVKLETGRMHQIRVHFSHIRYPLVGDRLYGQGLKIPKGANAGLIEALREFRRQALHAERLDLRHPITEAQIGVAAPRPADLQRLLDALSVDKDA